MTDHPPSVPAEESQPRAGVRRATIGVAVVFFVLLAGFWGWIWYYQLSNQGERDMPDRLSELAWTSQAEEICFETTARVATLPGAQTAASADERADVIDAATAEFEAMLDRIEAIAPSGGGRDATITAAWLADYREFLGDRYAYAEALRDDPMSRFLVTEKYGSHITAPIDRFARVNEMEGCMSPGDV